MLKTCIALYTFLNAPALAANRFQGEEEAPQEWTLDELKEVSEKIRKDVESIRGQSFVRPVDVKITDKDGFQSTLLAYVEEEYPEGLLEGTSIAARMLGLIPAEMDFLEATVDLMRDQVGGFYIPGTDTFYLMSSFTGGVAKVILAHELTHALDDQLYDLHGGLQARLKDSDATLAYQSIVEGSGMVVMTKWSLQNLLGGEIDMEDMRESGQPAVESLKETPRFLWLPLFAGYMRGASFMAKSDSVVTGQLEMGQLDPGVIRQVFEDPPVSSEQILHPQKYWEPEQRDLPRRISFQLDGLPEGWEPLYEDTLGELHLSVLVAPTEERGGLDVSNAMSMLGIRYTNVMAEGWGGDRLVLLGNGDRKFLRLVTLWDTQRDAAEFYGALQVLLPYLQGQLEKVADLDTARARARHRDVVLEYGAGENEVVLTVQFGLRDSEFRELQESISHREER
jgi:hypothetical protein